MKQDDLLSFALILFIASLGFEASVFPFNVLLPDVYQGAGAYVTSMLGGINKKVGFAALIQVLLLMYITSSLAFYIVAILCLLTMFYGNLVALTQNSLKRLLAYSSISQSGYILIGIAVRENGGLSASFFQIFAHVFLFIGAMAVIAWLESRDRTGIDDLIGLYKENKFCAISLSIFFLALIGMPFTTGFMGKFLLFLSAVNSGMAWLAMIGIVNSIISIFYYIKAISAMYTNKVGAHITSIETPAMLAVLACLSITLVFGVYPQPVINIADSAAAYLLQNKGFAPLPIVQTTSNITTTVISTIMSTVSSTVSTASTTLTSTSTSISTTSLATTSLNTTITTTVRIGGGIRA